MYPGHRLDLDLGHLAFAMRACLAPQDAGIVARRLEGWWSPHAIACLSVRSAFDLWLGAMAWPAESEVVFSAINMPDMARIARAHGLVPVAADLEPRTLLPTVESIARVVGPRTRAIVIAQLFGARADLSAIGAFARARGLLLVEDAAQAFRDPRDLGSPHADVSLFSFGSIKTTSALGGALARVPDDVVRARMHAMQAAWPRQEIARYLRKVLKFVALLAASPAPSYALVIRACALLGRDFDEVMQRTLRGFGGEDLLEQIRKQPCAPLLALLERRLLAFDGHRVRARAARGDRLARRLPHVGGVLDDHVHWVFPLESRDPDLLVARLRAAGFHATRRGSNLGALDGAARAAAIVRSLVFVPAYPELPDADLERLISTVHATEPPPQPTCIQETSPRAPRASG